MRGVLKRFESTYKFPKRNMHGELITVNTQDPIYKLLNQILFFVQNELGKTEEIMHERKNVSGFVQSFYQQRFWSSFYSARKSLHNRKDKLQETINSLQNTNGRFIFNEEKQISIFEESEEDNEFSKEERKKIIRTAEFEIESLEDLIDLSEKILPEDELELAKIDPKIMAVAKIVKEYIQQKRPVILFSKYTDTVEFIERALKELLKDELFSYSVFTGERKDYISNDMSESNLSRRKIREKLDQGDIQLLLCSDAASEGLNLQSASVMINVDVPWVPPKLEQRIGRIDRLGQLEDIIEIFNIYYPIHTNKIFTKNYSEDNKT